jgi:hypothetical protein
VAVSLTVGDMHEICYFPDTFTLHNRRLRICPAQPAHQGLADEPAN